MDILRIGKALILLGKILRAHTYSIKRTYTIEAKDIYGDESLWGTFEITIPRTKLTSYSMFLRFLLKFSNAFSIFLKTPTH